MACQNTDLFLALCKVPVGVSDRALFCMPFLGPRVLLSRGSSVCEASLPQLLPPGTKHGGSCWEVFMVHTWLPSVPSESTGQHLFTRPSLAARVPEKCFDLTCARVEEQRKLVNS